MLYANVYQLLHGAYEVLIGLMNRMQQKTNTCSCADRSKAKTCDPPIT